MTIFILPIAGALFVFAICIAIMSYADRAKRTGPGNFGKPFKECTQAQLAQAWSEKYAERQERAALRGGVHIRNSQSRFDALNNSGYKSE